MEENLFDCSLAKWRIQNEYFDNLRTFKRLSGELAKAFDDGSKRSDT